MDAANVSPWMTIVKEVVTVLAIIVGGVWALFQFFRWREGHAKLEFALDLNVLGKVADRLLVEVVAIVENKGKVRHEVSGFYVEVRYLTEGVKFAVDGQPMDPKLLPPALPKTRVISDAAHNTDIDPGITQRYPLLTSLPDDAAFAFVSAEFECPQEHHELHTVEKCFRLRPETISR